MAVSAAPVTYASTTSESSFEGDKSSQNPEYYTQASSWNKTSRQYNSAPGMSTLAAGPPLVEMAHGLSPLDHPDANVLEFACGTGALTLALLDHFPTVPILATDISPAMLESLNTALSDRPESKSYNVRTRVLDMAEPLGQQEDDDIPLGSFSHIFCTMAIQVLESPEEKHQGALHKWFRLLRPGRILAISVWDFENVCGPPEIWASSVRSVDPTYTPPLLLHPGRWLGYKALESGMKDSGCTDVRMQEVRLGMDIGTEAFVHFVWESQNPWAVQRITSWKGNHEEVKIAMRKLLAEEYKDGWDIPLYSSLAVARRPL